LIPNFTADGKRVAETVAKEFREFLENRKNTQEKYKEKIEEKAERRRGRRKSEPAEVAPEEKPKRRRGPGKEKKEDSQPTATAASPAVPINLTETEDLSVISDTEAQNEARPALTAPETISDTEVQNENKKLPAPTTSTPKEKNSDPESHSENEQRPAPTNSTPKKNSDARPKGEKKNRPTPTSTPTPTSAASSTKLWSSSELSRLIQYIKEHGLPWDNKTHNYLVGQVIKDARLNKPPRFVVAPSPLPRTSFCRYLCTLCLSFPCLAQITCAIPPRTSFCRLWHSPSPASLE
jgi:hypothetical protein